MPRYTIDMDDQFDKKLTDLAKENNTTKSEIIRRALTSYDYLTGKAKPEEGKNVAIVNSNGEIEQRIILP